MVGNGGLLRWDGTSANLTALPVSAGSTPTRDVGLGFVPQVVSGDQAGSFAGHQHLGGADHGDVAGGVGFGVGLLVCAELGRRPGVPDGGDHRGGRSDLGDLHDGRLHGRESDGSCAATDNTDIWRGYLVITPVNHPADARLVRLRLNQDMTVDVTNQAGGATTVSIATSSQQQLAAFGLWTVDGGHAGGADAAVAADGDGGPGHPGGDAGRGGVPLRRHRRDVPAAQPVRRPDGDPAADRAGLDRRDDLDRSRHPRAGNGPDDRGAGERSSSCRSARRRSGGRTRPASPPTSTSGSGSGSVPSQVVTLADLPAPAAPTNASGPQIAATSSGGVAAPVDTGIDQAPLSVQVLDTNSSRCRPLIRAISAIYYRDDNTNTLLTNLFPPPGGDLDTFIGVSPYAGAYPNNGSAGGGGQSTTFDGFHYVATTSSIDQNIIGYLAINASQPASSNPIEVHASQIAPVDNTTSAANGISLAGCQTSPPTPAGSPRSPPAPPPERVTPAMYLNTTSGLQIGLLTALRRRPPCRASHCNTPTELPSTCWPPRPSPCTTAATQRSSQAPQRSGQTTVWTPTSSHTASSSQSSTSPSNKPVRQGSRREGAFAAIADVPDNDEHRRP